MSLATLRGVDPYLKEAMTWIGRVVESWGGTGYILSGRRTKAEQKELSDDCFRRRSRPSKFPVPPCPYPVATPGCSQHEYGFAVDAGFFGPQSGLMTTPDWTSYAQDLGRVYWGLSTVAGDPFHFAQYPTSEFLPWARETGQCPTQPPLLSFFEDRTDILIRECGIGAISSRRDRYGLRCFYADPFYSDIL